MCYQRENTQLTKELTAQQLLLTFSQGIQESGYTLTDWVFACDGGYEIAHDSHLEYLGHGTVQSDFENTTLPNRYSSTMSFSLGEEPYGVLFQSEDQAVPMS